ncbi:hypothetical protein D7B24_005475 [Verticillium nonalfalfae]|uniref:F-box domain-containing protein n=1 Tax=Verticillium nonalfalfae TaxID=1051616 RepID=A0A3M9YBU1_9PEZI|nr:uncharacterized protein D7B24_005475 [Verticillium nonalfalfae]RNJ57834.1 hypothetical protein D7B24_005475 [Verticillium nonalfalfae]
MFYTVSCLERRLPVMVHHTTNGARSYQGLQLNAGQSRRRPSRGSTSNRNCTSLQLNDFYQNTNITFNSPSQPRISDRISKSISTGRGQAPWGTSTRRLFNQHHARLDTAGERPLRLLDSFSPEALRTPGSYSSVRMAKDETEELIELINDVSVVEFLRHQPRPASRQSSKSPSCRGVQPKATNGTPILDLPLEMILRIAWHLRPADQAALYMSSKALLRCLHGYLRPMNPMHLTAFLQTLERDTGVGNHLYYCSFCIHLHKFDPYWGIINWQAGPRQAKQCRWWTKPRAINLKPHGWYVFITNLFPSAVRIHYYHGRLVMNRHRRGAPSGLPLERLQIERLTWTCMGVPQGGNVVRTAKMEPQVISDELFLCITTTVTAANGGGCSLEKLRAHVAALNLQVCGHEAMILKTPRHCISPTWLLAFYEQWRPAMAGNMAIAAWESCPSSRTPVVVSSCGACATDTVSWYEMPEDAGPVDSTGKQWVFTLKSYHQLGPCRRPTDFQRRGFIWRGWEAETFRPRAYREPIRDMVAFPHGSVMVRWRVRDTRAFDFSS